MDISIGTCRGVTFSDTYHFLQVLVLSGVMLWWDRNGTVATLCLTFQLSLTPMNTERVSVNPSSHVSVPSVHYTTKFTADAFTYIISDTNPLNLFICSTVEKIDPFVT